jgi:hypothetical protein
VLLDIPCNLFMGVTGGFLDLLERSWARGEGVFDAPDRVPAVFTCYQRRNRVRYPSTLHVSVGAQAAIKRPRAVLRRACHPMEVETYVQTEHLYNIQCSEIFTLRNEKFHIET